MDLTIRDIFYWLIDTTIWQLALWLAVIPVIIYTIHFLIELYEQLTTKDDGSEIYGGKLLFWVLVITLWTIIVEGIKLLIN